MKNCELCGTAATVHITETDVNDDAERVITRHLCEECAQSVLEESRRDSESATPPENETPEEIVAHAKQLAELMRNRNNREIASQMYDALLRLRDRLQTFDIQSPLYKRLRELHVPFGSTKQFPESREAWIDHYVKSTNRYWDRFVTLVEKHKRWPTDEEVNDLFEE